jgi:hypothetical protein
MSFFSNLVRLLTFQMAPSDFLFLNRTGMDVRTPASALYRVDLREAQKPPETAAERLLPTKNYSIIISDLTGRTPDSLVYYSSDKEKADKAMDRIERDLMAMRCAEFYSHWLRHPNFDFLYDVKDRIQETERRGM